jgi:hypothetical protein
MRIALAKYMKGLYIRNKDIVLHTPRIMTLVYMPTRAELIENQLQQTQAYSDRLKEGSHVRTAPTWSEWWAGRLPPGLTLKPK